MNICFSLFCGALIPPIRSQRSELPTNQRSSCNFSGGPRLSLCFDALSVCRWWSLDGDTFVFMLIFSFINCGAFVNARVYIGGNDGNMYLWLRKLPCFWRASWDRLSPCHELFGCYVSSELWSSSLLARDISSSCGLQSGILPSSSSAAAAATATGRSYIRADTHNSRRVRKRKFCFRHLCALTASAV